MFSTSKIVKIIYEKLLQNCESEEMVDNIKCLINVNINVYSIESKNNFKKIGIQIYKIFWDGIYLSTVYNLYLYFAFNRGLFKFINSSKYETNYTTKIYK